MIETTVLLKLTLTSNSIEDASQDIHSFTTFWNEQATTDHPMGLNSTVFTKIELISGNDRSRNILELQSELFFEKLELMSMHLKNETLDWPDKYKLVFAIKVSHPIYDSNYYDPDQSYRSDVLAYYWHVKSYTDKMLSLCSESFREQFDKENLY